MNPDVERNTLRTRRQVLGSAAFLGVAAGGFALGRYTAREQVDQQLEVPDLSIGPEERENLHKETLENAEYFRSFLAQHVNLDATIPNAAVTINERIDEVIHLSYLDVSKFNGDLFCIEDSAIGEGVKASRVNEIPLSITEKTDGLDNLDIVSARVLPEPEDVSGSLVTNQYLLNFIDLPQATICAGDLLKVVRASAIDALEMRDEDGESLYTGISIRFSTDFPLPMIALQKIVPHFYKNSPKTWGGVQTEDHLSYQTGWALEGGKVFEFRISQLRDFDNTSDTSLILRVTQRPEAIPAAIPYS